VANYYEIARRLGLDGDTGRRIIAYDRAALLKGWKAAAVRDLDAAKGGSWPAWT
jgi:hypothetical protein